MEELRSVIAPIAQRYFDKEEEKRQSYLAQKNEAETMRKAQEDMLKKQSQQNKGDSDMKDAEKQPAGDQDMDMD
jgi:heat shock protein 4